MTLPDMNTIEEMDSVVELSEPYWSVPGFDDIPKNNDLTYVAPLPWMKK